MTVTQLEPPIPVTTPLGNGEAVVLIDRGRDYDLEWVVLLDSRECWTFPNPLIRRQENATAGIDKVPLDVLFNGVEHLMSNQMYTKYRIIIEQKGH